MACLSSNPMICAPPGGYSNPGTNPNRSGHIVGQPAMLAKGKALSPENAKKLYEERLYGMPMLSRREMQEKLQRENPGISLIDLQKQLNSHNARVDMSRQISAEHPGITAKNIQRKIDKELAFKAEVARRRNDGENVDEATLRKEWNRPNVKVPQANLLGLNARAGAGAAGPNLLQFPTRAEELEGLFGPATGAPSSGSSGGARKSQKQRRNHRKSQKSRRNSKSRN